MSLNYFDLFRRDWCFYLGCFLPEVEAYFERSFNTTPAHARFLLLDNTAGVLRRSTLNSIVCW